MSSALNANGKRYAVTVDQSGVGHFSSSRVSQPSGAGSLALARTAERFGPLALAAAHSSLRQIVEHVARRSDDVVVRHDSNAWVEQIIHLLQHSPLLFIQIGVPPDDYNAFRRMNTGKAVCLSICDVVLDP